MQLWPWNACSMMPLTQPEIQITWKGAIPKRWRMLQTQPVKARPLIAPERDAQCMRDQAPS